MHVKLNWQDHMGLGEWVLNNPEKSVELLLGAYEQESSASLLDDTLAAAKETNTSSDASSNPSVPADSQDLYVEGVEIPVARMKRSEQGVELTLIGERRPK